MKQIQLWVRRVTMEIVVRAPDIQQAEKMTEDMVNAAIDLGRQAAVYGDVEAQAFIEFDDSTRPLVERIPEPQLNPNRRPKIKIGPVGDSVGEV